MLIDFWDVSALVKRFIPEPGHLLVNRLFASVPVAQMVGAAPTMGELLSVAVRTHNSGRLRRDSLLVILAQMEQEVIDHAAFLWAEVSGETVRRSLSLIPRHSINCTDALILRAALDAAERLLTPEDSLVLVSADARLVRAARA